MIGADGHKFTVVIHIFHPLFHKVCFIGGSCALSLVQGAFPARLKKVLIVGAPVWFRVPYNLLSLLLKEKLRERVSRGGFLAQTPWWIHWQ